MRDPSPQLRVAKTPADFANIDRRSKIASKLFLRQSVIKKRSNARRKDDGLDNASAIRSRHRLARGRENLAGAMRRHAIAQRALGIRPREC
jgi:hypothetical protein